MKRLFYKYQPMLELDYEKLCKAFVYHVFYMYLTQTYEKMTMENHAEVDASIDLLMKQEHQVII